MWFNFFGTSHHSRDLKRRRSRFTRRRVVARIHAEGSGLDNAMDQNPGAHSDGEGTPDSTPPMVREGGHTPSGSHEF